MSLCNKTYFQLLCEYAHEKKNFTFIEDEKEKYSISEFVYTVCDTANLLVKNGVKQGDIVAIKCEKDIETIIYFYACQILGAVAFMLDCHDDIEAIEKENNLNIKYYVLENRSVTKALEFPELLFSSLKDSKQTTILISTSGSTGQKKIVELSQ